jgi:hypothetical protein
MMNQTENKQIDESKEDQEEGTENGTVTEEVEVEGEENRQPHFVEAHVISDDENSQE